MEESVYKSHITSTSIENITCLNYVAISLLHKAVYFPEKIH